MNPVSLRLEGVGRFPELSLVFPDGCTAVIGANATGKSTILNCIEMSLFAQGSADLAPLISPWTDRLVMELVFEHAGETYRVRQSCRRAANGRPSATVDFEKHIDGATLNNGWMPLSRENADATRALIVATLGLSRATFRASAFLAQGDAAAFVEKPPAERKGLLGEILDPHQVWPTLAATVRDRARTVDAEITADRTRIQDRAERTAELPGLRDASATLERHQAEARAELAEAERSHQDAQHAVAANQAAVERRVAAQQAVDQARQEHARAVTDAAAALTAATHAAEASARLAELEVTVDGIPYLEQKTAEQREQTLAVEHAERQRHEAQVAAGRQEQHVRECERRALGAAQAADVALVKLRHIAEADEGTERCDRCQQLLGAEAQAAAVNALRRDVAVLEREQAEATAAVAAAIALLNELEDARDAITVPEPPVKDWTVELAAARRAESEQAALTGKLPLLEQAANRAPELEQAARTAEATLAARQAELAAADQGAEGQQRLHQAVLDARQKVTGAQTRLEELVRQHAALSGRILSAEQAARETAEIRARTEAGQKQLDLLRLAERAYGRDGIPTLVAENSLAVIEADANTILQRMPLHDGRVLSVRLESQKEVANGDRVAETLAIWAAHEDSPREVKRVPAKGGNWTFSGGEMFRISFALRWALAKLLAGRRSADVRVLVIDEPDGLDSSGMDALAVLATEASSVFDKVLVISHQPQLASSFEQTIEVEIVEGVSRVATR
jgi:DNA repair protein SbcC/Rad50